LCREFAIPQLGANSAAPVLRTPAAVLRLLEALAAAVRADPLAGAAEKARAAGYLAGLALKAIEANNLAARVEMLEAVLKQRPPGGTP
jgi:hypothetical protein